MAPTHAFVPTALTAHAIRAAKLSLCASSGVHVDVGASLSKASSRVLAAPSLSRFVQTPHAHPLSGAGKPSRVLYWFHSDLRLDDNVALKSALEAASQPGGAFVPVVVSPCARAQPLVSELAHHIASKGSTLLNIAGDPKRALLSLCQKLNLHAVYFNRSTLPAAIRQEAAVISALSEAGIHVEAFWGNSLCTPTNADLHKTPDVRSVLKTTVSRKSELSTMVPVPESMPQVPANVSQINQMPIVRKMGGGSSGAWNILNTMDRGRETVVHSSSADLAITLKTHLDFGSISPRSVAMHALKVVGSHSGRTFSELVWRTYVSYSIHSKIGVRSPNPVVAA